MASIAYVSDQNMLDYHRINGNQNAVFWRVSTKKFSSYQPGDLLFFLAKGSENARHNEKGIVGYGCFVEEKQLSIATLWKKYETETGYRSKEELISAIQKTTKKEALPEKISCLLLKNVIFFQGPIYLSELGIKLPSNLESFTYLDAHEGHVTLELLQQAKEIGIDYWAAMLYGLEVDKTAFNREILRYQIATVYENMDIHTVYPHLAWQKHCFSVFREYKPEWINNEMNSFIVFGEETKLYYIYSSSKRDSRKNFITMLGQLIYIDNTIKHTINEDIKIVVLSEIEFSDLQKEALFDNHFDHLLLGKQRSSE